VAQAIGKEFGEIADAEDIDTLGGLITTLAGHVPLRGEILEHDGIEFEVLDADPRRVKRVKITLAAQSTSNEPEADGEAERHKAAGNVAHLPHSDTDGA
ncbi:MAG: transporter associated domain-containing protein, partial [Beijerinckiaceae bacterium]